jgi:4-amino-4-deoxychorismate lyase
VKPTARPVALAVLGRGILDPDEPLIHADDVGLLRGQAAFETVRVYAGRPFALHEHLERLFESARRIGLAPVDGRALERLAASTIEASGMSDCSLRLTFTGGREGADEPVVIVAVSELPDGLEETRAKGISVVSLQLGIDVRLRRGSPWLLAGVKSTSYAVNMAAWEEARRRGADDALFLAADGSVLEGPVTNVWWRHGDVLATPSLDLGVLAGVTRAHVIRLAGRAGYRVEEGWYPLERLATAVEAFTSSSVREIMPVVALDGRPIGDGRPGRASARLQAALREAAGGSVPTRAT